MNAIRILMLMCYLKLIVSLKFNLNTKVYYVDNNDFYYLSYEKDNIIRKCSYSSNIGLMNTFSTDPPLMNQPKYGDNVRIFEFGHMGLCQIKVEYSNYTETVNWVFSASDGMATIASKTVQVIPFKKAPILSKHIHVFNTAAFVQQLTTTNINYTKCVLLYQDQSKELEMDTTFSKLNIQETLDSVLIRNLHGICGFRFELTLKSQENEIWTLVATDENGILYGNTFSVTLHSATEIGYQVVGLGEQVTLNCSLPLVEQQLYCLIYDTEDKIVWRSRSCENFKFFGASNNFGLWRCSAGYKQSLQAINYYQHVSGIEIPNDEVTTSNMSWYLDYQKEIIIGCRISNIIDNCILTSPIHERYVILPYLATHRYLGDLSDFENGICALRIDKPLRDWEMGSWRCEVSHKNYVFRTFIEVNTTSPAYRHHKRTVKFGDFLTLIFELPFTFDYCYVKAPNNSLYVGYDTFYPEIGSCTLNIEGIAMWGQGNWTGIFGKFSDAIREEVVVEVTVIEDMTCNFIVNKSTIILCKSDRMPLKYCTFISPNNTVYFLTKDYEMNGVKYHGRDLKYGECGMEVTDQNYFEYGKWTCIFTLISSYISQHIRKSKIIDIVSNASIVANDNTFRDDDIDPLNTSNNKHTTHSSEENEYLMMILIPAIFILTIIVVAVIIYRSRRKIISKDDIVILSENLEL